MLWKDGVAKQGLSRKNLFCVGKSSESGLAAHYSELFPFLFCK